MHHRPCGPMHTHGSMHGHMYRLATHYGTPCVPPRTLALHSLPHTHHLEQTQNRLPRWVSGDESICQCRTRRKCRCDPWVGKVPWRRQWQPTAVFLPGESHGQRSLAGYSPWGCKESDRTEVTQHTSTHSEQTHTY